jgi:epsilon-lactone hydrolase
MATFGTARDDVDVTQLHVGGRRALRFVPSQVADHVILYLHGGGLTLGSPESHSRLTAHLAARSKATLYSLDYRLAPENPFPAGIDDTVAAVRWLLANGVAEQRLFVAGDSGGAALVLAALIALTEEGHRLGGGIVMSPWADFTLTAESFDTNATSDAMCSKPMMMPLRDNYCPAGDFEDPRVSPAATGNFTGLPPLMIQASAQEVLLDDAKLIAARGREAGVDVTFEAYPLVPHVFQLYAGNLPEADEALQSVADWMSSRLAPAR